MIKHEELIARVMDVPCYTEDDAKALAAIADELEARAREIEGLRKQDDALILQLEEALTDIVEAGEEAWGKDRPCVRIGKEAITAGRARLGRPHG